MIVMKFGGTSIAVSEAIERAVSIVRSKLSQKPVVVVSALSKVTDTLYGLADVARHRRSSEVSVIVDILRNRHQSIVMELIPEGREREAAIAFVDDACDSLCGFVSAVCTLGELTPRSEAKILGYGEWLSSNVICHVMNHRGIDTAMVDARDMIITDNNYLKAKPDRDVIMERVPDVVNSAYIGRDAVVTQGFIAATTSGEPTVLGRGGSDYTASLVGMALDADAIEIWTDVDGVRTADPRRIANTRCIERISFEEAAEMAHFGAKILHPLTIEPAVMKNIPVYVLNSMNPSGHGTVVLQDSKVDDGVKSISFKENIMLVNIFSTSMIDVPGFLSRVFSIFARHNVSVDLISTSEANISLTLDSQPLLKEVVEELSGFAQVKVVDDKSQVSIIGKNVVSQRGLLRWAMYSLNNIDIYMISQGTSGVNISLVVDRENLDEVLQQFHSYLFEY